MKSADPLQFASPYQFQNFADPTAAALDGLCERHLIRRDVVVIAATNFLDKIDAALRRAGRLDRELRLEKPTTSDLVAIFRHRLCPSVLTGEDLLPVALAARDRTGADVEAM
jgi:SpoVK/Ycf46/Vps4 family AAA+-type ATPase